MYNPLDDLPWCIAARSKSPWQQLVKGLHDDGLERLDLDDDDLHPGQAPGTPSILAPQSPQIIDGIESDDSDHNGYDNGDNGNGIGDEQSRLPRDDDADCAMESKEPGAGVGGSPDRTTSTASADSDLEGPGPGSTDDSDVDSGSDLDDVFSTGTLITSSSAGRLYPADMKTKAPQADVLPLPAFCLQQPSNIGYAVAKCDQLRCISDDGDISAQFLAATGPLAGAEFLACSCFRQGQTPFFY